jgi:hypothetical protein
VSGRTAAGAFGRCVRPDSASLHTNSSLTHFLLTADDEQQPEIVRFLSVESPEEGSLSAAQLLLRNSDKFISGFFFVFAFIPSDLFQRICESIAADFSNYSLFGLFSIDFQSS